MRFEAKHKNSKIYFHNVNSRINPPHTLAIKCQIKFAKFLTDHAKSIEPYLRLTSREQSILNNNNALEINKNHGSVNNFKFYNQLEYKGTAYKINYYLGLNKNNIMLFKIKQFLIHKINVSEV